jgi:tetratricopeptide (TPR) repeat protein
VKEGLERIPAPPAGGEARGPLLDGILALVAGDAAEARKGFDGALAAGGGAELRAAALVLRSRARVVADDLDGAVSDLDTLVREAPKDARAKFLLGHTLSARAARRRADGKPAEGDADSARAAALLEEARKDAPDLVEASLALAERHFVEGRSVDAIRELSGVLDRDPDRVEAHLVLGNIMKAQFAETRERSFYEQGREHFLRVLSSDATDARALSGLGEMAAFANKPKEALAYTLRALNADPDHPAARALAATLFVRTGRARLEEGDVEGATESAKRADEMGGETASLCLLRADVARRKNDWARAGAEVERARTLAPTDGDVRDAVAAHYRDVGYAFLLRKRHDQADEAFRRAVAAKSERVDLAEVQRILDRGDEAEAVPGTGPSAAVAEALDRAFEEARRLADEGVEAHRAGKPEAAAEKFRASLRSFETPQARFGLGLCLAAAGDGAAAEAEYRRAVADEPEFADAWLNLGALLFKRRADAAAADAYEAYLRTAPKSGAEETVVRVTALLEELKRRRAAEEKK